MAKISPVSLTRNGEVTTTRVSEAQLRELLADELSSSVRVGDHEELKDSDRLRPCAGFRTSEGPEL